MMTAGPLRRISYSLVGLAAGIFALVVIQFINNIIQSPGEVGWSHLFAPKNQALQTLGFYAYFAIALSVPGWAMVGLPIVLWLSTREIARASWPVLIGGGSLLGPLAVVLAIVYISRGQNVVELIRHCGIFLVWAAIVSGLSFSVHCILVRRYARLQPASMS